jgi:hypothetical protein
MVRGRYFPLLRRTFFSSSDQKKLDKKNIGGKIDMARGFAVANHDIVEDKERFYEDRMYHIEINEIWNSVEVTDGSGNVLYYSKMEEFLEDFRII